MYTSAWMARVAAAALVSIGCAAGAAPLVEPQLERCGACGTVVDVDPIFARGRAVGGGAMLGALVGGAVGDRLGRGDTTTTVAGAAAGAAFGHGAASRGPAVSGYTITVEMDAGDVRTIRSRDDHDLDRGDRVRLSDGGVLRL